MNLTTAIMDSKDNQARTRNIELNEFPVRGGEFSYKSIKPITSIILMATMFSLNLLGPSSLTHSLQIYCTRLTGPISLTLWAWAAKRVPIIGAVYGKNLCISDCIGRLW